MGIPSSDLALVLLKKDGTQIEYSWIDYEVLAVRVAVKLLRMGVKADDFVSIIATNLPESFLVMRGIILTGAIPVPINPPLIKEPGQKELKVILNDCKPKVLIASQCFEKHLSEIPHVILETLLSEEDYKDLVEHKMDPKKIMIMPYTSGTTGGPKGVMLSRENIKNRVDAVIQELKITNNDRILSYLSLGHISELIATFFGQLWGGYQVYFSEYAEDTLDNREKFREALPFILQTVKPTVFLAVPKIWINFKKEIEHKTRYLPIDFGRRGLIRDHIVGKIKKRLGFEEVRIFISAGSKFSLDDKNFFTKLGIYVDDVYGQTETAGPLTINGKVIGKTSVLTGPDDEILVKGQNVMLGYFNNTEATAKVLENGVFHTGDAGLWQTDGVFFNGRLGDGFKNAQGEFVSPEKIEELEEAVRKINGVDEAIIYGADKPHNIALIFSSKPSRELSRKLEAEVTKIGQGMYRIKKILLINSNDLELTPTLKVRRKVMLKKFADKISKL